MGHCAPGPIQEHHRQAGVDSFVDVLPVRANVILSAIVVHYHTFTVRFDYGSASHKLPIVWKVLVT